MVYLLLPILMLTSLLQAGVVGEHATVYFSPDDHLDQKLIDLIEQENVSLSVAVYCFTHKGIASALLKAKQRGVAVEIVVDRFSVKVKAPLTKLVEAGIPVFVWDPDLGRAPKAHRPLMHHKFCLFGSGLVWTGSFNFTYEASRHHEESSILIRDPELIAAYREQFNRIKAKTCVPFSSYILAKTGKKRAWR